MMVPQDIADLLWNCDASKIDIERDTKTVIMAVVRLGDFDQIKWLFSQYGWDVVKRVIGEDYFGARSLPVSVRAFWGNLFWPSQPPPELTGRAKPWHQTRTSTMIDQQAVLAVRRRLRTAMSQTGLSQKAFASLLSTSQPRLSSYLSGKVVPSAVFVQKAELLAAKLS